MRRTFLVYLASTFTLHSQTVNGRIVGVVQDTNGGSIWNAQVTILSQETGLKWSYTTDVRGSYGAPSLPSGGYRIQVAAPGFRTAVSLDNFVMVARTTRVDLLCRSAPLRRWFKLPR